MARVDDDKGHKCMFGETTNRCVCDAIRMHRKDFGVLCAEWDKHYDGAKDRVSAKSFEVCAKGFVQKNTEVVKECARRASERLMSNQYPTKPRVSDPRNHVWLPYKDSEGRETDYLFRNPKNDD